MILLILIAFVYANNDSQLCFSCLKLLETSPSLEILLQYDLFFGCNQTYWYNADVNSAVDLSACKYVEYLNSSENNIGDFSCLTKQTFSLKDYARCDSSPACGSEVINLPDFRKLPVLGIPTVSVKNEICKFSLIPNPDTFDFLYTTYLQINFPPATLQNFYISAYWEDINYR